MPVSRLGDSLPAPTRATERRPRLNDGWKFRAVKVFWEPEELQEHLANLGWAIEVATTEWAFIYGIAGRAE
jgi:hypothetical protein